MDKGFLNTNERLQKFLFESQYAETEQQRRERILRELNEEINNDRVTKNEDGTFSIKYRPQ